MSDIPVQFELNDKFISKGGRKYIPPVSHEVEEAERRRKLPPGTLVLEQQYLGTVAAWLFAQKLVENGSHEDLVFGTNNILSPTMLGSAWFSLRGGRPPVMRRHLTLPTIADPNTEERVSEEDKVDITLGAMEVAADLSEDVYQRQLEKGRVNLGLAHKFGHAVGDAALWAAVLPHNEIGAEGTIPQVQQAVLQVGMNVLDTTRRLRKKVGMDLSVAMLGEQENNLTNYIRQKGTHGAYNAFRSAQSEAREMTGIK